MQRLPNVGNCELSHQSRRRLMGRWLISALILAATVSVNLSAWGQSTAQNRGLGKVTPEYVSWYHSRVKTPIYLVDNQGRNAARILIYTWAPPGAPVTQHVVRGNEQFDKDVKLKIIVDNLTTNCKVDVNWLAFLFREDGQPSPVGLNAPPGADPDTSVAAGQSYVHIFTFTEVKTYVNRGTPVLHEVKPEIVLQCSADSANSANVKLNHSGKAPTKTTPASGDHATVSPQAMEAVHEVAQVLANPTTYKRKHSETELGDESYSYDNLDVKGCKLSLAWHVTNPTTGVLLGEGTSELDFHQELYHELYVDVPDISLMQGWNPQRLVGHVYGIHITQIENGADYNFDYDSDSKASRDQLVDAIGKAAAACGAQLKVNYHHSP